MITSLADDGQYERQTNEDSERGRTTSETRPRTAGEPDGVREGQKGGGGQLAAGQAGSTASLLHVVLR